MYRYLFVELTRNILGSCAESYAGCQESSEYYEKKTGEKISWH